MKRNLVWLAVVLCLCAFLRPTFDRHRYDPEGGILTVDGVPEGEPISQLEKRFGQTKRSNGYLVFNSGQTRVRVFNELFTGQEATSHVDGLRLEQAGKLLVQAGDSRSSVGWSLGPEEAVFSATNQSEHAPARPADVRVAYAHCSIVVGYQCGRVAWVAIY